MESTADWLNGSGIVPSGGSALFINTSSAGYGGVFERTDTAETKTKGPLPHRDYDFIAAEGVLSSIYDLKGCFALLAEHSATGGILAVKDIVFGVGSAYLNSLINITTLSFVRAYRPEEIIEAAGEYCHIKHFRTVSERRSYPVDGRAEAALLKALADTPYNVTERAGINFIGKTLSLIITHGIFVWEKA
jgi:hypothetical protein